MTHKYTQNYPSERKGYPHQDQHDHADEKKTEKKFSYRPSQGNPEDGGKLSPADAERIASEDLPPPPEKEIHHPKKKAA